MVSSALISCLTSIPSNFPTNSLRMFQNESSVYLFLSLSIICWFPHMKPSIRKSNKVLNYCHNQAMRTVSPLFSLPVTVSHILNPPHCPKEINLRCLFLSVFEVEPHSYTNILWAKKLFAQERKSQPWPREENWQRTLGHIRLSRGDLAFGKDDGPCDPSVC